MAEEHEREDEADGPIRPSQVRRPTLRTDAPVPGGHQQTDHTPPAIPAQERTPDRDERQATPADPRFANAPMSAAEMTALYNAPTREAAFALLGQMQEERLKDGRIPQAPQPQAGSHDYMSLQDIQPGMAPLPQQKAHIQSAPTIEENQARTIVYLETRAAQNEQLFERSRRWAPEVERLTGARQDDRIQARGVLGWRADIPDARREVATGHFTKSSTPGSGGAPDHAADERFLTAPLSKLELQTLAMTSDPNVAARMLGVMQQDRESQGRLEAYAPRREPTLNSIVSPSQQIAMGLRPTQSQIMRMQAGSQAEEMQMARAFIAERQAANAYWQQRARQWSPQQQRDARTEMTDKGLSRSQRAAAAREARMQRNRDDGNERGNDGHGRGGRGR